MGDTGHEQTDKLLAEMERKISREYKQAVKETQEKLDDYLRRFEIKDKKWRSMVANGEKTEKEYQQWRIGQIMIGQRWEEMRDSLAEDYHHANIIARSVVDGYMPDVYALNHNYATFQVEKGSKIDTSYTLYDRQTVERIMQDNPDLLPPPGKNLKAKVAAGEDVLWQEGQIQSVTMQSILQGESIPNMAKRIASTMGETNFANSVRYARTATTGAENAGRLDGYKRASEMGIQMRQTWVATLDNRTRHEHRQLDGQTVDVDEPFEVNGFKIRYPGDPEAEGFLIWNCRCTTIVQIKGFERDVTDLGLRNDKKLEGMTYEEWKDAKAANQPITHQKDVGEAMRRQYIRELYGGKGLYSVDNYKDALTEMRKDDIRDFISDKFADAPESYKQALLESVNNMTPEMAEIVRRTTDNATVYYEGGAGTCTKLAGTDTIVMYKGNKTEQEFVDTFWHEYGHLTDKSPNSGYSIDVPFTDRRGKEGSYSIKGIAGIAEHENKYSQAAADDINAFLTRYGLNGKYEAGVSEWGGRFIREVGGDYLDTTNMTFEQSKELSDALTKWVQDFSGQREAWDYLYSQGYPRSPKWDDYFETYKTPKRGIIRTREKYKGATIEWQEAVRVASDAQDVFTATHDMDAIFAEQRRLEAIANAKADKLGFVTDTFDESAFGAFHAVVSHGGHSAEYYMQGGHDEYVANTFSVLVTKDDAITSGMQDLCPNLFNLTGGIILG